MYPSSCKVFHSTVDGQDKPESCNMLLKSTTLDL
uniref:Uncharacterized protein n=1 Tax=Arundo donax TaxID=35708 RepID=A0A0A9CB05_ARUDO